MEGLTSVNEEQIRQIAYELWEREGRPPGRELDHYYSAQQLVTQKRFDPAVWSTVESEPAHPTISETVSATGNGATSDAGIGAKPAKRSTAKKAGTKPRSKRA
jgi:hypothetical protein